VPRVSSFYGITIRMYFDENLHPGRPHFHAEYGGAVASFGITALERLTGSLPVRIERLVRAWAKAHEDELIANWNRARRHQPVQPIDPLNS
jgi:hypothetical protein